MTWWNYKLKEYTTPLTESYKHRLIDNKWCSDQHRCLRFISINTVSVDGIRLNSNGCLRGPKTIGETTDDQKSHFDSLSYQTTNETRTKNEG